MRQLVCAVLLAPLLLMGSDPAGADYLGGHGNTLVGYGTRGGTNDQSRVPPPGKAPAKRKGKPRIVERGRGDRPAAPTVIFNGDRPACVEGGGTYLFGDPHDVRDASPIPDCPAAARGTRGRPAPPPPSARDAAFQAWYWETKLPDPSLATSPANGAVAGLDLYLSIGGPQELTLDVPALGYLVHLEVSSVYDVSWGDPRPDGTALGQAVTVNHPTRGGPYPTGDLRHQYIHRGSATIEVTQKWTARWSANGESGTIADRLATSSTVTIPVQEIQAVITG